MFIDSHCHIEEDEAKEYVDNAINNDVKIMINAATDLKSSVEAINLSRKYPSVFACIGVHPEEVRDFDFNMAPFEEMCKDNKVVAIGEIGLDYYYEKDTRDLQIKVFREFLSLAERNNLPVVIHSRNATDDTLRIIKEYKVKGVIHCFSGSIETAREYIKLGFVLGIGGVVTFKNSKLIEVLKEIPFEYIILETDSPYLSPEPFRGQTNESKNIKVIAEYLSDKLSTNIDEIREKTTSNVFRIFDKIS